VNLRYDGGALAHGRRDTLRRSRSHVTNGEYPVHTGLKRQGARRSNRTDVGARQYKSILIRHYAARPQPGRIGLRANEKEKMMRPEAPLETIAFR